MLNVAQIASLVRVIIIFVGGLAAAKGLVSQDMVDHASDLTFLTQMLGAAAALFAGLYAVWARRKVGLVAAAAALPEVAKIETTSQLASAVPLNNVVPANGTYGR